jgi:epoxide hydrolase-like predicted phosphatase
MIKNLIFDFGKVLVDYDFEAFFRRYITDEERCRAFTPILHNEEVQRMFDREEHSFDEIIEEIICQHREFEQEIRYFATHYPEIVTNEVEGMRELLTRLKGEGYGLYGLTNWCSKVYLTMAQFEIFDLLDGYIISSEEKVIKPEAEIYQRLFNKFNLKPEECLFADDRAENIEGGRRVGMEGIVFTDARQYERELEEVLSLF